MQTFVSKNDVRNRGNIHRAYRAAIEDALRKPAPVKSWKDMTPKEKDRVMADLEKTHNQQ